MSRCDFTRRAARDLEEIHDYIAADSPMRAARFTERIEAKCRMLADSPGTGRSREELARNLRSFPVGNYLVFYRPTQGGIDVIRVSSGVRDIDALFRD